MEDYRLEQTGQEVQRILNGAAMDANLQAEVERATDAEGTLQENIDAEAQARQDADGLLQQGIDDEAQRAKDAEEANAGEIEGIKALIPSTASEVNKLADTNYVNSSIQTATAEYRGDYNVVTDLHLAIDATHAQIETLLPTVIAEADKNDYCYVMIPTSAQTPTEIAKIERYKMTSEGWKFEYDVNNSTFTAEEWAAIKSGITSGLVAKLNALPTNADLLLLLAGKQDVLTFDATPVPESNNPVKSGGVYSAIDDEKTARLNSDTAIHTELDGLQAKVPATASSDNKLVDQNQMNTSISTATATYRGDWNVVSDLHLAVDATRAQIAALLPTVIATADNNDYCYVEIPTNAETPTQIERVERYKFNGTAWAYEYTLNNSGFTADQWAAINSMITSGLVAKLSALPTNADLLAMLAQKQDNLTFDTTPTENSTNPVTSGGVFAADKALSDAIEAILLLIPSAASALNKLVDTALMNSSISTATATFRGTYNLVSDLGLGIDATEEQIAAALLSAISTADNNDYAFVQIPTRTETPTQIARTDRYKFNGTAWAFEYTLNTSGFTAAQWAAINSTITSALVAKLNALPTAAELHEALGTLTSGITAINQKIPSTASQSNKLVDNASMESYIAQVINTLDATFNITSTDGHITLHITQVDGVITSVQVQSTDIASAADLALKASQADLTALASRVTTAEGNITSLTGRIGTAETNIANLQQLYNNLQQSKPVPVTALPSTGQQQGVIYRLAGTTSYSDYMWNGSSWFLMATYNNAIDPRPKKASQNLVTSGGVFDNMGALDVSELNATENPHTLAQYADLSAALAAIPTDYQKGGMSVKFVRSSDNKYVQYRFMLSTFTSGQFINPVNWQEYGAEPLAVYNREDLQYIFSEKVLVESTESIDKDAASNYQYLFTSLPYGLNAGESVDIHLSGIGTIIQRAKITLYPDQSNTIISSEDTRIKVSVPVTTISMHVETDKVITSGEISYSLTKISPVELLQEDNDFTNLIMKIGSSETEVTNITWVSGVINSYGKIASSSRYFISSPIAVKKNDVMTGKIGRFGADRTGVAWAIGSNVYNPYLNLSEIDGVGADNTTYDFRLSIPEDGQIVFVSTDKEHLNLKIRKNYGNVITENVDDSINLEGTDLNQATSPSHNLFNPTKGCINKSSFDSQGNISASSTAWISGYIDISEARYAIQVSNFRMLVAYNEDFTIGFIVDNLNGYYNIIDVNRQTYPNLKYIRFQVNNSNFTFDERSKISVISVNQNCPTYPIALLNPEYIDIKKRGYFSIDDVRDYSATIINGTYISENVFNDENDDPVTLNTSDVYLDITSNNIYRYKENEGLYLLGYYDGKSLPFTSSFNFYVQKNDDGRNMIVTANARYYTDGITDDVPTIYFRPRVGKGTDTLIRRTIDYTIGNLKGYTKREWRAFPLNRCQDRTQVVVTIPEDVTLFMDEFYNYYSDKKSYGSYPILNCRNLNAPGQTLAAFEQAVKIGYDHIIAIPKRSSDGVWFVFHDDADISAARNEDGSAIVDPQRPTSYTYDQLLAYDMGMTGAPNIRYAYAGQKIPLLEDFFELCAKTGVHPVLSVHPNWTQSEWREVKALTDRWGVTKHLGLKGAGGIDNLLSATFAVFGNNIESYFQEVNDADLVVIPEGDTRMQVVINVQNAISSYGIDTDKVVVGIEFFTAYISDAHITNVVENGLPCAVTSSDDGHTAEMIKHWIRLGISQMTDGNNPSVGLNW